MGATLQAQPPSIAPASPREQALAGLMSASAQMDITNAGRDSLHQPRVTADSLKRFQYLFCSAVSRVRPAISDAQDAQDVEEALLARSENHRVNRVCRVTAYCDRGVTASGVQSGVGQCAAPGDIPFGTLVYIPQLRRTFVVTDRTNKRFRHNTVDIFISSTDECIEFGLNYLDCEFMLPPGAAAAPKLSSAQR